MACDQRRGESRRTTRTNAGNTGDWSPWAIHRHVAITAQMAQVMASGVVEGGNMSGGNRRFLIIKNRRNDAVSKQIPPSAEA